MMATTALTPSSTTGDISIVYRRYDRGRLDDAVRIVVKRTRGCVVTFDASLDVPKNSLPHITAETIWSEGVVTVL